MVRNISDIFCSFSIFPLIFKVCLVKDTIIPYFVANFEYKWSLFFLMIIKSISILWSLIFPNPVLMVLKFWKVKYLVLIRVVLIRGYCVFAP